MSSEDDISTETCSLDSVHVDEVISMELRENKLFYLCRTSDDTQEYMDRSDLMDMGPHQSLILKYEREHPPPWDEVAMFCDGEKCEECVCDICNRKCRHINGVNYGCTQHPVV